MTGVTTEVYRVLRETPVLSGNDRNPDDSGDDVRRNSRLRRSDGLGERRQRPRQSRGDGGGDSDDNFETYMGSFVNGSSGVSFVLQRGDLVEVCSDHMDDVDVQSASPLRRRSSGSRSSMNIVRLAQLTNGLGYISVSNDNMQKVDVKTHSLMSLYVDNYPLGQCGLRQPIDRPEFRHAPSCVRCCLPSADSGQPQQRPGQRHPQHYVPGQLVFSCQSVQQGRTTFYRIQHVPSSASSWESQFSPALEAASSVWLADSRPRSSTEEDPHDDVTLLLPFDKVNVECGPFAYKCLRTIELRTKPDVGNLSRSGRFLLRGDVCVATLVRESPFAYGNGPFGLLEACNGLWCFERIRNGPPLLVSLEVERGDWTMQVRSQASLPVLRQPSRQAPSVLASSSPPSPENHESGSAGSTSVVDATGSTEVVRLLERNEIIKCDARFESPSTGTWFYHVVGTNPFDNRDGGWVPDRSVTGRTLLVQVHDDSSLEKDLEEDLDSNGLVDDLPPWSMDFVRGVATIASTTLQEVSAQEDRKCMVFLQGSAMVHVFLATRTVEVEDAASHRAVQMRRCTPHQLSQILQNPMEALESGSVPNDESAVTERDVQVSHEEEMEIRRQLVDCEAELDDILLKRRDLFEKLRPVEDRRRSDAIARLGMDSDDELFYSTNHVELVIPPELDTTPPRSSAAARTETSTAIDDLAKKSHELTVIEASPTAIEESVTQPHERTVIEASIVPAPRRSTVTWEDGVWEGEGPAAVPGTPEADRTPVLAGPPLGSSSFTSENGTREDGSLAVTPVIHNSSRKRSDVPETSNELQLLSRNQEQESDDDDDDAKGGIDDNLSSSDGTALSSVGEQLNRTCGVCHRTFETARLRSVHCLKEHGKFSCNYCPQVFDYVSLLHRHRDHENHW